MNVLDLRAAAHDWHRGTLYLANDGHYRLKGERGHAPYSRALLAAFPSVDVFHDCTEAVCTCDTPEDCYACAFEAHTHCAHGCGAA